MPLRILILDGNLKSVNDATIAAGGKATGEAYQAVLAGLHPDLRCSIVKAADPDGDQLPPGVGLADFDGAAITGSALNLYDGGAAIDRQIELARALFDAGVPTFGSCWGLQLMTTALGGSVRKSPKGRELFIARNIWRTAAGRDHPMLAGRPPAFDAPCIHLDEVETAPADGVVLASNEMSAVQAMSVVRDGSHFWGVQYHPEFSLQDLASILRRIDQRLVDEGLFDSLAALHRFAASASLLSTNPEQASIAFEMGVTHSLLDPSLRLADLRNWIETVLLHGRLDR